MASLNKKQKQEFRIALRKSNTVSKLMAKDLVKLKTPLFRDYLFHVKRYAGTPNLKKQYEQQQQFEGIKDKLIRNNSSSSYYYCQRNQLLSLKQFVILMEQSKKKTQRDQRIFQRQSERKLAKQVEKEMQKTSIMVNLRLTSSYAKRLVQNNNRKSII